MRILPNWKPVIEFAGDKMTDNWSSYLPAALKTKVPAAFIALIHTMECGGDMKRQILNGQPWNQKTSIHPKGKGPWPSWEAAAVEALRFTVIPENSIPAILYACEAWNGFGYTKLPDYDQNGLPGVDSPYVWSGTNHAVGDGKYVADGKYDPNAVSKQIGCAPLLQELIRRGLYQPRITYDFATLVYDPYGVNRSSLAERFQQWMTDEEAYHGAIDGWLGPKSDKAYFSLFAQHLAGFKA